MVNTMTDVQTDLIRRLKDERQPDANASIAYHSLRGYYTQGTASEMEAEILIKRMLNLPFRNRAKYINPGVYETATGLVRVYHGQHSGRTLAKLVMLGENDHVWFQYMGLASRHVPADARRLTVEEISAATLEMKSTICLVCGRRLDDPESTRRGIGPVCIKNYGA